MMTQVTGLNVLVRYCLKYPNSCKFTELQSFFLKKKWFVVLYKTRPVWWHLRCLFRADRQRLTNKGVYLSRCEKHGWLYVILWFKVLSSLITVLLSSVYQCLYTFTDTAAFSSFKTVCLYEQQNYDINCNKTIVWIRCCHLNSIFWLS